VLRSSRVLLLLYARAFTQVTGRYWCRCGWRPTRIGANTERSRAVASGHGRYIRPNGRFHPFVNGRCVLPVPFSFKVGLSMTQDPRRRAEIIQQYNLKIKIPRPEKGRWLWPAMGRVGIFIFKLYCCISCLKKSESGCM
jgi:hypothetical protein